MTNDLGYYLSIYIHAHKTGNSVPPHIEAKAIAALNANPETAETASKEAILARVKFADHEFNTPSDIVLRQFCDDWFYADPSRKEIDPVDLCRAAIKLFAQIPAPISLKERLPKPEDCAPWPDEPEANHWCWLAKVADGDWEWSQVSALDIPAWRLERVLAGGGWTHWLPHWALSIPVIREGA